MNDTYQNLHMANYTRKIYICFLPIFRDEVNCQNYGDFVVNIMFATFPRH